jgi:endosialidase-like protein
MTKSRWIICGFLVVVVLFTQTRLASAQNTQPRSLAGDKLPASPVTGSASDNAVRFTSLGELIQMRLEVIGSSGETMFDSGFKPGNAIDWPGSDSKGKRLVDGAYVCIVSVKDLSGQLTKRQAVAVLGDQSISLTKPNAATPSSAQAQVVAALMEGDVSVTIVESGEPAATAVLAHDGNSAQLVSGGGGLAFSSGDFFANKTLEHVRITAEGNVGIGVRNPQAKLDVAGVIRASQGIVFPDGTIQYSAASKTLGAKSARSEGKTEGGQDVHTQASGTGTTNFIAKWTDNAGALGNSAIFESAGNVGIGTATPQAALDYRSGGAALFTRDVPTNPGVAQSVLQLGVTNVGSRNAGIGASFLFFGDNSAGAKSFLGRVSGVWENPTAGAEAGAIFFQVRANSADATASTERMRITAAGNVGIGTSSPATKLDVVGNINTSTQYNISGQRVLTSAAGATTDNIFAGVFAGQGNTTGTDNSFFGVAAGGSNTEGSNNTFIGRAAGFKTRNGLENVFVGYNAGYTNDSGSGNTVVGANADMQAINLTNATAIGSRAFVTQSNSLVLGSISGVNGGTNTNVGIGTTAPAAKLHIAANSGRILIGDPSGCVSGRTGLGFASTLTCANYSLAGNGTDTFINASSGGSIFLRIANSDAMKIAADAGPPNTHFSGQVSIGVVISDSGDQLCINGDNYIVKCGSSIRFKTNVNPFTSGLGLIRRLRPVSFDRKRTGDPDFGLIAEEVAEVEPLLITRNKDGQIDGVKYDRVGVVVVNAVKEQQAQIEAQQAHLDVQRQLIQQQQAQINTQAAFIHQQQTKAQRQEAQLAQQQIALRRHQAEIDALKRLFRASHPRAAAFQRRH